MFTLPFNHSHLHTLREHFSTLIIFLPSLCFSVLPPLQTGSKPSPKSSVTEMESKEMPDCWWGLWLTGIAGSWNVQRQRESKGAQVFQMESEGSRGLSSAL